jgi:class 3 adenylate cyclase/tetratricopeptide (TPR) repeat protein
VTPTVACPSCGAECAAGQKFCGECATPLALSCPTCGAAANPGQKFCGECATPLAAGATPAPAAAAPATNGGAVAERRLVTVLFADLVSFTTLSEHRDPEVVRDMLEQYFERCRTIIGRYGGIVEKFIGDAVMAVWGTPVAREDDAERAVRAGLELVGAVTALGEEIGMPELRVRAGLLTGETAVNIGAEHEGMVIGDAVNTASRIQSLAEPETVFVEDATRRATESAIAYEDGGEHQVKGRAQPVRVWKALRVIAGVGGSRRGGGLEAPFVGRDAELRAVTQAGERVISKRCAELVTVIGDAGMGKSRLSWEFEKKVDGIADDVWYYRGRCLSYGEGVSFWALAEIVRTRARIAEHDPLAEAHEKLRATVDEFVSDERERRLVLPRLEHLLGLGEGSADPGDLFSGWRLFFERLADVYPLVMVFEDLQWADTGLLEFIDYLMEWASESPILVLALARPEVLDRRPGWAADAHRLEPLPPPAMHDLLSGLIPGLPEGTVRRLAERSEGIPLYAVETVRMMLDRGVLAQEGDVYIVTGDVDEVQVPETLHALVASRLDSLAPRERGLLQDAAVLGQTFFPDGVAALADLPVSEVTVALDGLVGKQILEVEDDPTSPERGQYGFVQALIKTIAYGTLGRKDRKARHLAAATYLERSWGDSADDFAEVLATHYTEAVRADPDAPDAASLRTKATDTLTEAGRRAMSFGLGDEAYRWFERAAEMATEPLRQAELLDLAGRGALLAADSRMLSAFERSMALYEAAGDTRAAAVVRARAAERYIDEGRSAQGVRELREVLDVLGTETVDADVAFVAKELARMYQNTDHAERGLEPIAMALAYAERVGDVEMIADALITRGTLLNFSGRGHEGSALMRYALALALDADLSTPALRAYTNLPYVLNATARFEEVLELTEPGIALAELAGNRSMIWSIGGHRATALAALGRWDEALVVVGRLEGIDADLTRCFLAPVYAARGDRDGLALTLDAAAPLRDEEDPEDRLCAAIALAAGTPGEEFDLLLDRYFASPDLLSMRAVPVLLEAAASAGRADDGERVVARVRSLGAPKASRHTDGVIARFRGRVAQAAGDAARAETELRHAVDWLRESGDRFELAKALRDLGETAEADAIFAELGAVAFLDDAALPA